MGGGGTWLRHKLSNYSNGAEEEAPMGVELTAKLLLRYFFFFFNLILKALSGVWDHPGVPNALEESPLPACQRNLGLFTFVMKIKYLVRHLCVGGQRVKPVH